MLVHVCSIINTVKLVQRDHPVIRPPLYKDHLDMSQDGYTAYILTFIKRPPLYRDQISLTHRWSL